MKSLYLRIWLTVVAVLALFALVSGVLWQRHLDQERQRIEANVNDRLSAWADLLQRSLPGPEAAASEQDLALQEWSQRLRVPMALEDAQGRRVATSESFERREAEPGVRRVRRIALEDGRTLLLLRGQPRPPRPGEPRPSPRPDDTFSGPPPEFRGDGPPGAPPVGPDARPGGPGRPGDANANLGAPPKPDGQQPRLITPLLPWLPAGLPPGVGLTLLLAALFVAVALGAYPVVRRLTRRLEALKQGVETFGAGHLGHRVQADGGDEVAAVAKSFNNAAERLEALVRSHQSLLANASHELRSPLARLKMAVSMYGDAQGAHRDALRREIDTNVAELDALVEEVLLASRLDAAQGGEPPRDPVDLLGVAVEEAVRVGAEAEGEPLHLLGDERLLRRALRNLLENARRYGGAEVVARVQRQGARIELRVCDRGPGVPEAFRERIFEPFFRLPGHAEREGGVGLGLSLVRQIAERHGGSVRCEAREGGGSCFVISLPATMPPGSPAGAAPGATSPRP